MSHRNKRQNNWKISTRIASNTMKVWDCRRLQKWKFGLKLLKIKIIRNGVEASSNSRNNLKLAPVFIQNRWNLTFQVKSLEIHKNWHCSAAKLHRKSTHVVIFIFAIFSPWLWFNLTNFKACFARLGMFSSKTNFFIN